MCDMRLWVMMIITHIYHHNIIFLKFLFTVDVVIFVAVCSNGVLRFIDVRNSVELWTIGSYEHKVIQVPYMLSVKNFNIQ